MMTATRVWWRTRQRDVLEIAQRRNCIAGSHSTDARKV
jgi:hypothetical protein